MTIPTQLSLQGFIATEPQLSFAESSHARFYCRVGIEQHRKEVDGSFTKLDPVFCDMVLFDRAAERAYPRFKPGDQIVASGYIHEYELGCPMISGHEFWVFQAASWGLLWRSRISCGVLYPNPE